MSPLKSNLIVGLNAGLAATVLAPMLMPALKRSARLVAKTVAKGGMLLYQKGREAVAQSGETIEDILAELQAEEGAKPAPAGNDASPDPGSRPPREGDGSPHLSAGKARVDADREKSNDTTTTS